VWMCGVMHLEGFEGGVVPWTRLHVGPTPCARSLQLAMLHCGVVLYWRQ
jgi:hypothetical protein